MGENQMKIVLMVVMIVGFVSLVFSATDPGDMKILNEFRKGLENSELLDWPEKGDDPCGPPKWPNVFCNGARVTQIQVQGMGLKGPLPQDFNQLTELVNLGLQRNHFSGKLPTFKGLSQLQFAYLGSNDFDMIPSDFFEGLDALQVVSLDNNPLNASAGWSIPNDLQNSLQLQNLTLMNCSLVATIPDFLGTFASLGALKLSYNRLTGGIPASLKDSELQYLWLNNQGGEGLSGPIDVISTMGSLKSAWLHGNTFTGKIPADIGALASLEELNLNQNQLVGPIPESLATIASLKSVDLSNNILMGSIPKLKSGNISCNNNPLCQSDVGVPCAPEVTALINFLGGVNYPINIASQWKGNNPCQGWIGVGCTSEKVSSINLPHFKLNGTLSPSLSDLDSLTHITLRLNYITGQIPIDLTNLKSLEVLDLSQNNIKPPVPKFRHGVSVLTVGNPLLDNSPPVSPGAPSPDNNPSPDSLASSGSTPDKDDSTQPPSSKSKKSKAIVIIASIAISAVFVLLLVLVSIYCLSRKKGSIKTASSFVVHPRDPSDPENMVKIVLSNNTNGSMSTVGSSSQSIYSSGTGESHVIESGNLVISVQVLRNVTNNFSPENELGRGGFGTVYKGELDDGTKIAVKRMQAGMITNKALDEFQAEIAVLSKVRHRHLVSLLGYCVEGNERLLVYEYMPQGALSKHLFHWDSHKMEPLSWKRRLNIALDVARGMEYLHNLAHQSFIHRDLKSSNILLGDDFRAKVSDFGLVKLAPDGEKSLATRLAGTFGYLAPEYAVTGKISTKADVFSYGVVLIELLTGLTALDEERPEESRYLASWFWHIKSNKEKLMGAIDKALEVNDDTYESIRILAELAGHCTAREPSQRPDMGHAVNVLSPLVEKWKPFDDDTEEYSGIDFNQPLTQMVKGWQEAEGKDCSYTGGLDDSKGSIPARPTGFADSFTSADGR